MLEMYIEVNYFAIAKRVFIKDIAIKSGVCVVCKITMSMCLIINQ